MKIIFNILLLFPLFITCQNNKANNTNIDNTNFMIEKILKKQLIEGAEIYLDEAGVDIPKEPFTDDELKISMLLSDSVLKSNGFKEISSEVFQDRVYKKLNRIIDYNSNKKYLYINFFDKCDRDFINYPYNGVDYNGAYIDKERKFFARFYFIPEIIDYQKNYINVAKIEDSMPLKTTKFNESATIYKWSELENHEDKGYNLKNRRRYNQQLLVARNKYLFNDDKSQFVWLTNNDEYFMRSLVTTFGYTEDKKLFKWVIENTPYDEKNLDDFGKLLWTKNCNNTITIHNNIFDIIDNFSEEQKKKYLNYLLKYLQYVLDYDVKNPNALIKQISLAQKCELIGRIIAYGEKFRYSENINTEDPYKFMGWTFMMDYKELYKKEFERNNYYNLPEFKERYKMAEDYWVSEVLPFNE